MTRAFDVIVLGLGGMGSAAAAQLTARGQRVLGLEQFTAPHELGSSHGRSRIIRQAYFEDPAYVPLLLRAYELWRELERASGRSLLTITGGLMLGRTDSAVVAGSYRSAKQHGLPHELLEAREIQRRFPLFHPESNTVALYEKNAGVVRPEEAVRAHLEHAARHGATLRMEEKVLAWEAAADGVRVKTARGEYEAGQLVICAGPWAAEALAGLSLPFRVERQIQLWFEPAGGVAAFAPEKFPVWIWETRDGSHPYGLPAIESAGEGVKVAIHHGGQNRDCTAETVERTISAEEVDDVRRRVAGLLPALNGRCLRATSCLYTNTSDGHFLVDWHPQHERVLIVSPCSGHGFKFCPVIGEIAADLIEQRNTRHRINLFRLDRLNG